MNKYFNKLLLSLITLFASSAFAAEVLVAVASNFAAPAQKIATAFENDTGIKVAISVGATGTLYAQIKNGAPYQALLAADEQTPVKLEAEGFTQINTRFTYAVGKLVLWSPKVGIVDSEGAILRNGNFDHIAIADPKLAPYGQAAVEAVNRLGLDKRVLPKAVWAENIGQAYLFVHSQSALLGFVSLSQVFSDGRLTGGSMWAVPPALYTPIKQDAVITKRGENNPAVAAFMDYLKSQKAREIIRSYGYEL